MALGPAVYKLIFDTQGLESVTASRRELALQKKIMEETATTADKLAQSEANLDRMVAKGLITNEQKTAVLKQLKDEMTVVTEVTDKHVGGLHRMAMAHATNIPLVSQLVAGFEAAGPAGVAAAAAFAGFTVALNLAGKAAEVVSRNVGEQITKIDDLITAADTINVPVDQFERLAFAADLADISQGQFSSGMEKMLVGISKGADGSKKLVDAFNLIGLDAGKLREMQPEQAFQEITSALDKVPNAANRARAATAIFGSADFLRINTEHIDQSVTLMGELGAGIDEVEKRRFDQFDSNVKELNKSLDVTWQKVAMEIVPALGDAAEAATEWLVALNKSDDANSSLREMNNILRGIVASATELARPGEGSFIENWLAGIDAANPKLAALRKGLGLLSEPFSEAGAAKNRADELDAQLDESNKRITGVDTSSGESLAKEDEAREKDLAETRQKLWDEQVREYEKANEEQIRKEIENQKAIDDTRQKLWDEQVKQYEEERDREIKHVEDLEKKRADILANAEKEVRQFGMTEGEKKIDDAIAAGIEGEDLEHLKTLEKELDLRKAINSELDATSGVLKENSREAADAFAKANQLAVRKNFFGGRSTEATFGGGAVGFTATAMPSEPVLSGGFGDVRPPVMTAVPQTPAQETNKLLSEIKTLLQQQVRQDERTPVVEELTL